MRGRTHRGWTTALALTAALAFSAGVGLAVGNATTGIGSGGRVLGDISQEPGETDTIGLHLIAGQELTLKLSAAFDPTVTLRGPDGTPLPLGVTPSRKLAVKGLSVAQTGAYSLTSAATSGTQGRYKLTALAAWPKKVDLSGDGQTTFDVWMPADAAFKGKFVCSAGDASVVSVTDPSGAQIAGPITGRRGKVAWKSLHTPVAGLYRVTMDGPGAYRGTVVRKVRKARGGNVDVRNGLSTVSFARDGIAQLFASRCAACHTWATSYSGVTSYAKLAYARMHNGTMPQQGPPVVGSDR